MSFEFGVFCILFGVVVWGFWCCLMRCDLMGGFWVASEWFWLLGFGCCFRVMLRCGFELLCVLVLLVMCWVVVIGLFCFLFCVCVGWLVLWFGICWFCECVWLSWFFVLVC